MDTQSEIRNGKICAQYVEGQAEAIGPGARHTPRREAGDTEINVILLPVRGLPVVSVYGQRQQKRKKYYIICRSRVVAFSG